MEGSDANLIDHIGVGTVDFDRMRRQLRIKGQGRDEHVRDESRVNLPLREYPALLSVASTQW